MKKKLSAAQRERHQLIEELRNFSPAKTLPAPPAEVRVMDGGHTLNFRFEQGRCVAAPPHWSWVLRWSWREVMQYFDAHRLPVVLTGDEVAA